MDNEKYLDRPGLRWILQMINSVFAKKEAIPDDMTGATVTTDGIHGLIKQPHAGDQNKVFYGDGNYKYPINTWVGTCTTAANERIKEVSTDSTFALFAGAMIIVRYTNTNTYESSTGNPVQLDVNGTGARNIWYNTNNSGSGNTGVNVKLYGDSTRAIIYVYDGTYWVWVGCSLDSNTTYTPAGLGFGYGTCSTAESETAKAVTLSGYSLVKNGIVAVRFTYDVPASATLNVNSKGAKAIRYNNVAITAGVINAGDLATFIYTGSYYMLLAVDKATQPFTGASSSTDGTRGLIPAPQAGDEDRFLSGSGNWADLPVFRGVNGSIASIGGMLPPAPTGGEELVFKGSGEWGKTNNNFLGTLDEWNSLSLQQKIQYDTADIIPAVYWETVALKFSSDAPFVLSVANPGWNGTLEYTTDDGNTWTTWDGSELSGTATQPIYLRGIGNTVITGSTDEQRKWTFTGKYCTGNIETLLDYQTVANDQHPIMGDHCYARMFSTCNTLVTAPELPATTLSVGCYQIMFDQCGNLVEAPELPATMLADSCYANMFYGCYSLTTAPSLPATEMVKNCYASMFMSSGLTTAPNLPAMEMAETCYYNMFRTCRSLTTAPRLPATTLAYRCYESMFMTCTSLTTIPELPVTALAERCYKNMFFGCTSLKLSTTQIDEYEYAYRIPTSGTGTTATDALTDMFTYTGGTFKETPTINTTYYTDHEPV